MSRRIYHEWKEDQPGHLHSRHPMPRFSLAALLHYVFPYARGLTTTQIEILARPYRQGPRLSIFAIWNDRIEIRFNYRPDLDVDLLPSEAQFALVKELMHVHRAADKVLYILPRNERDVQVAIQSAQRLIESLPTSDDVLSSEMFAFITALELCFPWDIRRVLHPRAAFLGRMADAERVPYLAGLLNVPGWLARAVLVGPYADLSRAINTDIRL